MPMLASRGVRRKDERLHARVPPTSPMALPLSRELALDPAYERVVAKLDELLADLDSVVYEQRTAEPVHRSQHREDAYYARNPFSDEVDDTRLVRAKEQHKRTKSSLFKKPLLYANSQLPTNLPTLHLRVSLWPLIILAAHHSLAVYDPPPSTHGVSPTPQVTLHIPPESTCSARSQTKALTITTTSHPSSTSSSILVIAIRGTHSLSDWRTNFRQAPAAPDGFLDDGGNLCHEGFLNVARSMSTKIYEQLISPRFNFVLDDQGPRARSLFGRSREKKWTLILTGHSAGGAIASLIYMHLLSGSSIKTHLKALVQGRFSRVNCFTFGSPPVTLLPVRLPISSSALNHDRRGRRKKSAFLAFVNEGDPISRADRAYARSLMSLYATPAPSSQRRNAIKPSWPVPTATFSVTGDVVVMRAQASSHADRNSKPLPMKLGKKKIKARPEARLPSKGMAMVPEDPVEAIVTSDAALRHVVYGDPFMHGMVLYKQRIEMLASDAVTRGFGVI